MTAPELTARVRGSDGWPVPQAVLTLTDLRGQQVGRVEATEDGALNTTLEPGSYTAIVTAPGFAPAARTAVVTAGGAALGAITLERAGGPELPEPGVWTIDPVHSSIQITARHIGLTSVHGRFGDFGGQVVVAQPVERSTVRAEIQAASIDTGNKMRDDHLRSADFLGVDEHPVITFESRALTSVAGDRWALDGDLTLNAVRRPVRLDLRYLGTEQDAWGTLRAGFEAGTELRRDDFAITYNQVLRAGIAAVGTTLRVHLDIQLVHGQLPA